MIFSGSSQLAMMLDSVLRTTRPNRSTKPPPVFIMYREDDDDEKELRTFCGALFVEKDTAVEDGAATGTKASTRTELMMASTKRNVFIVLILCVVDTGKKEL